MTAAPPEDPHPGPHPDADRHGLVVTDEAGVLRAFNWTDYEAAMLAWIAKRYPKAAVREGRGPAARPVRGLLRRRDRRVRRMAW
jgi:hypothetical protein